MQIRFGTEHERYRYARPADIDRFVAMFEDPDVGRWLWFLPETPENLWSFFATYVNAQWEALGNQQAPASGEFVIEDADGNYLGNAAAVAVEGSSGGFEIGFQLAREAWGRGVGTRVAEFVTAWAIHCHDAYRIQGSCLEGNAASRKILESLGLQLEGTRPDFRRKADVRHTELLFGARVTDLDRGLRDRIVAAAGFED